MQGIPFIGLQRGTDFLSSFLPAAFPAPAAAGDFFVVLGAPCMTLRKTLCHGLCV